MPKQAVLVVDDDDSTRTYLVTLLAGCGYDVSSAGSGAEALRRLSTPPLPSVVLLDLVMPGLGGLETLDRIKKSHAAVPVLIVSAVDQIKTVVEAMTHGAADYLTKPFQEPELTLAIENVLEKQRLQDEVRVLRRRLDQVSEPPDLISSSPAMQRVREIATQVADSDAPVLLLGETGAGKEVVARFIHTRSSRRERALVRVNCAALPHELLESELFGYERGAFSGAIKDKPGKFEQADRGSLLLDEIGEMSPHLQAKLLHVLQDGEYSRLGSQKPSRVDVRILAATNRAIEKAVADGSFREDLYFRLNVIRLEVPPLRERREDIPVLVGAFVRRYAAREDAEMELPPAILEAFAKHDWPGNVRELENAVRRFLILPDLASALEDLRRPRLEASKPDGPPGPPPNDLKRLGADAAEAAERQAVDRILAETHWNRRETARRLNISYKALLNKLKKWQGQAPPD